MHLILGGDEKGKPSNPSPSRSIREITRERMFAPLLFPNPPKSKPLLLLSNAINHREGEKKWKREPPQPHAMQQQPMPMPAQAPPTAGITTEQIQKVPPLCPPPPFLFRFLAPVRVRRPRFLGGFFWGAKDLISFFIFARPPRMVLGLPAFDSIRGGLGS